MNERETDACRAAASWIGGARIRRSRGYYAPIDARVTQPLSLFGSAIEVKGIHNRRRIDSGIGTVDFAKLVRFLRIPASWHVLAFDDGGPHVWCSEAESILRNAVGGALSYCYVETGVPYRDFRDADRVVRVLYRSACVPIPISDGKYCGVDYD